MDIIEGETETDRAKLPPVSALDKIIVAIAGPLFSLLLAARLRRHCLGRWSSSERGGYDHRDWLRGQKFTRRKAGLRAGDRILQVDGKPVTRFSGMNDSVTWNVIRSEGATIPFVVERDGQKISTEITPYIAPTSGWRRKGVRQVLIYPATKPVVDEVEKDSPAAAAGLQAGDVIVGFNGHPMYNAIALADFIRQHPQEELKLDVQRGARRFETALRPVPLMTQGKMVPRSESPGTRTGK